MGRPRGNPWSGCHGERRQSRWTTGGMDHLTPLAGSADRSCPIVRLSDLTLVRQEALAIGLDAAERPGSTGTWSAGKSDV